MASEGLRPPGTRKGLRPHTLETAREGTQLQGPRAAETASAAAAAAVPPQGRALAIVCGVAGLRRAEASARKRGARPQALGLGDPLRPVSPRGLLGKENNLHLVQNHRKLCRFRIHFI